jgi:hypothetical protein
MNVMTEVHPYLDGKVMRMLIDGKWREAASGKPSRHATLPLARCWRRSPKAMPKTSIVRWSAARAAFSGP